MWKLSVSLLSFDLIRASFQQIIGLSHLHAVVTGDSAQHFVENQSVRTTHRTSVHID
jgi:hypothetical protein